MFLIRPWYAPDMIFVRSDTLAALQGPVRGSGNFHATTRHHALSLLSTILSLLSPATGPALGKKENSMAQPIVAHCRGGFTAPATSDQIWHTSIALSCSQHKD